MVSRLETVDSDLAARLFAAEPGALRRLATALAEHAVGQTGLREPGVDAALNELRRGGHNEETRSGLARLVQRLDEHQWELQGRTGQGDASSSEHLSAFARARAAAALECAFDPDPVRAAQEATYEALAAVDDIAAIRRIVAEQLPWSHTEKPR